MARYFYSLFVVAVATVLGYAAGKYFFERYESVGVVAFDMDLHEYKRGYELISNGDTLQRFFGPRVHESRAAHYLLASLAGRDPMRRLVTPVYRATRADVRDLGDFREATKAGGRPIIGLRFTVAHPDPGIAQDSVRLLAELVRQSMIKEAVTRYVGERGALVAEDIRRTEGEFPRLRFEIDQAQAKIADLKHVIKTYPQSNTLDQRQVVSVTKGTERFLSPVSQMIAEETRIIDLRGEEARFKRLLRQLKGEESVLQNLVGDSGPAADGNKLVGASLAVVQKILGPLAREDDALQETLSAYSADLAEMRGRWIDRATFVAGPSLPNEPAGLNAGHVAAVAGLLGLLVALLLWHHALVWRTGRVVANALGFGVQGYR